MGLDISAYSNAKQVSNHPPFAGWCEIEHHAQAYTPSGAFHRSFRGLVDGACYDISESDGTAFRAGSYGGYNEWRDDLSRSVLGVRASVVWETPMGYQGLPFYELINFSDCEGTIGPEAAVDLLKDFYDHRDAYLSSHEGYDVERYLHWLEACELAAAGGLIIFH